MRTGYHRRMDAHAMREEELRAALRADLAGLDARMLVALGRALERDGDRLVGGGWGGDGEGCLLTLAAAELGLARGEELLASSVAAVRIPAHFDELWALILARTGDAAAARRVTHRLVAEALALAPPQEEAAAAGPPDAARTALPR